MQMRTFLLKILVFSLGAVALIVVPVIILSSYDNLDKGASDNHNIISLQTKSQFDSLDILFVGNSYCYSSINTPYLDSIGISAFNLGIATAGVQFYDLVLNDYFNNTTVPPKKVLLLVSPMTFSSKADNFNAYPIHRYLEDDMSNFELIIKFNRYDELTSMYRKSLKKGVSNLRGQKTQGKQTEQPNNRGYFISYEVVNDQVISEAHDLYLPFKEEEFNVSKVDDLLDIASDIEKRGSEVVFFELPTHILSNYFSQDYLSDYKRQLKRLNDGHAFVSIDKSLFSSEHYRNIDHMNSYGADIATKEMVKLLNLD